MSLQFWFWIQGCEVEAATISDVANHRLHLSPSPKFCLPQIAYFVAPFWL